ncbi:hypothetical protein FDP41_002549 [Naegleria fowleri]|uniref:Guanylate cyclase domain-containing protein n=1 Tax=Naegleria fowleri TaxID=5763 RepID=A0A6A5C0N1_NAEFO|nr:uncharacterized protein FDP41_002549 [Naegleria fowleri]KAF0978729.1 hypothetical protein FDP41_002549 [Naegleria fowleri]CAG4715094.1 unnamed protein product [Naegleria fowleri]
MEEEYQEQQPPSPPPQQQQLGPQHHISMEGQQLLPSEKQQEHHQRQQQQPLSSSSSQPFHHYTQSVPNEPISNLRAARLYTKRSSSIVVGKGKENTEETYSEDGDENNTRGVRNIIPLFKSSRVVLLILVSSSILLTMILLTLVWVPTFSSSVYSLSEKNRLKEFNGIVSFITQSIREVVLVSEASKNLLKYGFDFSNSTWVERAMYQIYKSEQQFHKGSTVSTYIGDVLGNVVGIVNAYGVDMLVVINNTHTLLYQCQTSDDDICVHNTKPNKILSGASMENTINQALRFPGEPSFTPSYVDTRNSDAVLISLVNSIQVENQEIFYYFGYDISTRKIGSYLSETCTNIADSLVFIFESTTNNLISSSFPRFSYYNGNERKTSLNMHEIPRAVVISETLLQKLEGNFKNLRCGEYMLVAHADELIASHRICLQEDIDWVIVFSVKQWTYISTLVITLIVALGFSFIILLFGIIFGILASLKFSQPIYRLIELVKSVGEMDFDNIPDTPEKLFFSEMQDLQTNFLDMIKRIKSYRAFIPTHILQELESNNAKSQSMQQEDFKKTLVGLGRRLSSRKLLLQKKMVAPPKELFALGLEGRYVTQMCIFIQGFDSIVEICEHKDILVVLGEIYETLMNTTKSTSGQIGIFENNYITVSWNSTMHQPNHEQKGVSSGTKFFKKINSIKDTRWRSYELFRSNPKLYEDLRFRVTLATQLCQCGNIGTEEFKSHTIIGSIQKNVRTLIDVGIQYDIGILTTEDIFMICSTDYAMRYIDTADLAADMSVASSKYAVKQTKLFEVGESLDIILDEWIYELADKEHKSKWVKYQKGCSFYFEHKYQEAKEILSEFEQEYFKKYHIMDLPAQHMIQLCNQKMREQGIVDHQQVGIESDHKIASSVVQ